MSKHKGESKETMKENRKLNSRSEKKEKKIGKVFNNARDNDKADIESRRPKGGKSL